MKRLLLLSALLLNLVLSAQTPTNQPDADGKKHGKWVEKHKNGKKKYTGQFEHGVPVGEFKYYSAENGKLTSQLNYFNDGKQAAAYMYYPTGKVMASGKYYEHKKDSLWTYYNQDGVLLSQETYYRGIKEGEWKVYSDNGKLSSTETWKNDVKEGPVTEYSYEGVLIKKGNFVNNKPDGLFMTYYPNTVTASIGRYKNGVKDGEWLYRSFQGEEENKEIYENGQIVYTTQPRIAYWDTSNTIIRSKEVYNLDRTTNYICFYPAGRIQREGHFYKNAKHGEWKYFSEKGELDSIIIFNEGNREGISQTYSGGKLSKKMEYLHGVLNGVYEEYYPDGSKMVQGTYNKGKKQGTWKYFNQQGAVLREEKY
ncbi:MAG: toxin-antitoxin system YwqK family antitoxin [Flavobacteriales bacterium]